MCHLYNTAYKQAEQRFVGFLDFVDVNNNTDISQQILIGAESYSSILKSAFSPWPLPRGSGSEGSLRETSGFPQMQLY